ncbi:AraC family transcriptional regulator [Paenibacillus sp. HB172176]|uniref:helix-turn-helix domain-containing protein n=1 Tax=Paenibacillus sp. HB172176 TaxID=2493690 RepID=UPI00143C3263|nr:AraC family transcriptional regulator [Paenibacillus sp. HB172176]
MFHIHHVNDDRHIPNWRTPLERIAYNVFVLVMEGEVRYEMNGQSIVAEEGDFLYIPEGTVRSGRNADGRTHRKYTVLFQRDAASPSGIPFIDSTEWLKSKVRSLQYTESQCVRLFEEMRGSKSFREILCGAVLLELFSQLARELEKPDLKPNRIRNAEIIEAYLHEHYREAIEIEQLAGLINRSPNYTSALFKEVYGYSPIPYMHQLRVMEACNLLLFSDMSVTNIAQHLGYYDTSYFFRVFKKHCRMSPTDFIAGGTLIDMANLQL